MNRKGIAMTWLKPQFLLILFLIFVLLVFGFGKPASIVDTVSFNTGSSSILLDKMDLVTYSADIVTSSPSNINNAREGGDIDYATFLLPLAQGTHPADVQLKTDFIASKVQLNGLAATNGTIKIKEMIATCQAMPQVSGQNPRGDPYTNPAGLECKIVGQVESVDSSGNTINNAKFYGLSSIHIEVDIYKIGKSAPTQTELTSQVQNGDSQTVTIDAATQEPVTQQGATGQTVSGNSWVDKINFWINGIIETIKGWFS